MLRHSSNLAFAFCYLACNNLRFWSLPALQSPPGGYVLPRAPSSSYENTFFFSPLSRFRKTEARFCTAFTGPSVRETLINGDNELISYQAPPFLIYLNFDHRDSASQSLQEEAQKRRSFFQFSRGRSMFSKSILAAVAAVGLATQAVSLPQPCRATRSPVFFARLLGGCAAPCAGNRLRLV
jgi:hypothetical protein